MIKFIVEPGLVGLTTFLTDISAILLVETLTVRYHDLLLAPNPIRV